MPAVTGNTANVKVVSISKAEAPTAKKEKEFGPDILETPYNQEGLRLLVDQSTIIQQCIEAYKRNIVGFGATPKYKEDENVSGESPEKKAEWTALEEWIEDFNYDMSFTDLFAQVLEDREVYGVGYIEGIRNGKGQLEGGEYVDASTIRATKYTPYVDVEQKKGKKKFKRRKAFRRFVQIIDGKMGVWFKEYGDPRIMDNRTGKFVADGATIQEEYQANELIPFRVGKGVYGTPRWVGHVVHMDGARKAETLNNNYFSQGRHTPMAIILNNAKLSIDSEQALIEYANGVQGVENAHKFLIIESEAEETGVLKDKEMKSNVELKSLADMLQQDALFLEYDESSRQKVQSSFRLPDIYVGRSKDFNRATADMARTITEEQVFEPERTSLAWVINNKLLESYEFEHVKADFEAPDISDPQAQANMIKTLGDLGAYAANDLREVAGKAIGKDLENFEGEEFDTPSKGAAAIPAKPEEDAKLNQDEGEKDGQGIAKSYYKDDIIVNVLKDVRDVLDEMKESQP